MNQVPVDDLIRRESGLNRITGALKPDNLVESLAEARGLLGEPPGNPDGLEDLAHAFRNAGQGLETGHNDTKTLAAQRLPVVWSGAAADAAGSSLTSEAEQISNHAVVFKAAETLLSGVADALRKAHQQHAASQQQLADLEHRARALPADSAQSPEAVELTSHAGEAMRNAARVLATVREQDEATAKKLDAHDPGQLGALKFVAGVAADQRKPIEQILREYQVTPDPNGMVMFPSGPLGWLAEQAAELLGVEQLEPKKMTAGEAELLERLGPEGTVAAFAIYDAADKSGDTAFGGAGERDGHADAYRHTYWNALLTQRFGPEWTEDYTTAHERLGGEDRNAATVEAMDLHNNEVGRRIALENPDASAEELGRKVEDAVRGGQVVVHGPDGQLAYSDQVPIGQSGIANGPPGEGGRDPGEPGYHSDAGNPVPKLDY